MSNQQKQKAFALDCEMIDAADHESGHNFAFKFPIKVVIVDEALKVVYDRFIKPRCRILCDNAFIHGIDMSEVVRKGIPFGQAQSEVELLLRGNIIVGHDLDHDLKAMGLDIPTELKRDTSTAKIFARIRTPPQRGWEKSSLVKLAQDHLNEKIQQEVHDPVEDAITSMKLYNKFKSFSVSDWSKPTKM